MPNYLAGVYKNNNTTNPDYYGCTDTMGFSEDINITNEDIESALDDYYSEVMTDSSFKVILDLLVNRLSQIESNSQLIEECYNTDIYDDEMTYKLASLYDIDYPLDYDPAQLRLLIKVYPKIRKVRGQEKSIKMLLKVLERSETDLYLNNEDDTTITIQEDGSYLIHNSRITNIDFAKSMIRKVIQAGLKFSFTNE